MKIILISFLINVAAFYFGAKLLSGITMKSFTTAMGVALVVALLNATLGLFLKIITFGILAFGLFKWILNAILILVADWLLDGFKVKNFLWALGLAAFVAIFDGLFGSLL